MFIRKDTNDAEPVLSKRSGAGNHETYHHEREVTDWSQGRGPGHRVLYGRHNDRVRMT